MVSLDYFFEGVEKLLEIWFGSSDGNNNGSLLNIPSLRGRKFRLETEKSERKIKVFYSTKKAKTELSKPLFEISAATVAYDSTAKDSSLECSLGKV